MEGSEIVGTTVLYFSGVKTHGNPVNWKIKLIPCEWWLEAMETISSHRILISLPQKLSFHELFKFFSTTNVQ